ncbi:MAG: glycogen synthase GlgA [Planctomycetaceae bacterium]|nr:glycogen synthase GlgA [Planctomycetaceae bacterium]
MNILFASSEVVPFAKTGGLADVVEALPRALEKLGHHPVVFVPAYRHARQCGQPIEPTDISVMVRIGSKDVRGRLLRSRLPDSHVPVYLVEQDSYYDRPQLYRDGGNDYRDNCERFVFFCRAVMQSLGVLEMPIDVLHCHDWQTGLIPAYLKIEHARVPGYEHIASLFTLHNLAYQGNFWHWDMLITGLDWKYFNWHQMEFHGHLNLLKTGIVFADALNTVSPQYAQEIQTEPLGCGLAGVLRDRRDVLSGILNGVNYDTWNPQRDGLIAATYDVSSWQVGKARCKAALQRELGLPIAPRQPLIGLVGRLANQKGWCLVAELMRRWVGHREVQWAVLGTGEEEYHHLLHRLSGEFPTKVAVRLGFSDPLAHRIEAGCDMLVMASQYEPCGLNQLYSLKYGTVPIVHRTGGLADTITDATPEQMAQGTANGFSFSPYTSEQLEHALNRACHMYEHEPEHWQNLVTTGMQQDWSWDRSAQRYVELYTSILAQRRL